MGDPIKIGFTGTQDGLTPSQHVTLWKRLHWLMIKYKAREFHHGDCVGADEEAFKLAKMFGYVTVAHPGPGTSKRAFTDSQIVHHPRPYLTRNEDIAFVCDQLIACPKGFVEVRRSGTWATVRRARKHTKPVTIILPDGALGSTSLAFHSTSKQL